MTRPNCQGADMQPELVASPAVVLGLLDTCQGCPLWDECERLMLEHVEQYEMEPFGVWAGRWYGPAPRLPRLCELCGEPLVRKRADSRAPRFCSERCRSRARRAVSA